MPTALNRTYISHTPPVRRALDAAERRWPGEKPHTLLVNLIVEGGRKVAEETDAATEHRLSKAEAVAGQFQDVWGPGYLEGIREGWPE